MRIHRELAAAAEVPILEVMPRRGSAAVEGPGVSSRGRVYHVSGPVASLGLDSCHCMYGWSPLSCQRACSEPRFGQLSLYVLGLDSCHYMYW